MDNLIINLGILVSVAALFAVILKKLRQPRIIAYIGAGVIAGLFRGIVQMPHDLIESFIEVGIILLLFMAGLEVDLKSLSRRWRLLLYNGLGQIAINTVVGGILALLFFSLESPASVLYFGLCLTFSSTIIVLGLLREQKEMQSLHGQIIVGLMVLQDIVAVVALSVLKGMSMGGPLLLTITLFFIKLILIGIFLGFLAYFVLGHLFRFLAQSTEMLFIGTLGYALGVSSFCGLLDFSPEIGAFLAGVSLWFLPYKLEIEDELDPLKSFGILLFFITLGYTLDFGIMHLSDIVPILVISLSVVLGTPLLMIALGWFTRINSRPAFLIGGTINQMSEFSLILATFALQAGVFDSRIFLVITLSFLLTIFLSSMGHQFLVPIYSLLRKALAFLDKRSNLPKIELLEHDLKGHIILLHYNELAEAIIDFYSRTKKTIFVLDVDPDINESLKRKGPRVIPAYADVYDPEVWEEYHFDKASIIISCIIDGQDAEIAIARWLRLHNPSVPFIAATDSSEEALELYEAGVRYVIQTEDLAARHFKHLFAEEILKKKGAFRKVGEDHYKLLRRYKEEYKDLFYSI